jgi:YegS/Rv2252/BmrU family lipid kinase
MPGPDVALITVALVVSLAATVMFLTPRWPRHPAPQLPSRPAGPEPSRPAVVINPTRFDDASTVRAQICTVCAELGWAEPLWLETSAADPGLGQAEAALAAGVDVVLACGGDGTIRNVAQILAGSGIPLGLLPAGTGNLLARNLGIPLDDLASATRMALCGLNRPIDVGRVWIDEGAEEQVFLVMAGMGFDAAIMAGAPSELKARVGPLAYFISGIRALKGPQIRIAVGIDAHPELRRRVRTVVVGNCGKLLAGLVLMPAAKIDDGLLDVVAIAPQGIIGWLAVTARVLSRRRSGHPIVEHWQGTTVTLTAEGPHQAQLDGDPIGEVRALRMRTDQGALLVRVRPTAGLSRGGDR